MKKSGNLNNKSETVSGRDSKNSVEFIGQYINPTMLPIF